MVSRSSGTSFPGPEEQRRHSGCKGAMTWQFIIDILGKFNIRHYEHSKQESPTSDLKAHTKWLYQAKNAICNFSARDEQNKTVLNINHCVESRNNLNEFIGHICP